jgi:hypothetical protein
LNFRTKMGRCRWACRFEIRNSTGKKFKHIRLLNTHRHRHWAGSKVCRLKKMIRPADLFCGGKKREKKRNRFGWDAGPARYFLAYH